ncbi:MAG TPA: DUF3606 domain-containing protein [Candidatus Dormibacteraeota bacterium]|nr:DUF3606 domain-containing protein [Candidatus Dormibacteraeota bacterium]
MARKAKPTEVQETRLNLSDDDEVRYWASEFRVSESDLRKAAEAAGTRIEAVRNELRRRIMFRPQR